ncbi:hypothetical protein KGV52_00775 [Candidatus Gracilibacteria bacterium]|nr:hypothetical protein [Candidatus Gracilibacteria bacterium]
MNVFKKLTATAALVALASGLSVTGVSAATATQIDAANTLAAKGIVVDKSKNPADYELDRNVLRQEIAAVARGIAGIDKTTTCENLFSDVSATNPNTWACYTVEALRKEGRIAANPKFNPEQSITKAESLGMVVNACKKDAYAAYTSSASTWQEKVVEFAAANGLVSKFSDYNALATRGFVFEAAANCYTKDNGGDENIEQLLCQLMGTCKGNTTEKPTEKPVEKPVEKPTEKPVTPTVKGEAKVELSAVNPVSGNIPVGTSRARLLTFDVTAGNEDLTLNSAELKFIGLGDSKDITNVGLYAGDVKVTKGNKSFQSDNTLDVTFERNTVIKAGETATLYVGTYIKTEAADEYQSYSVKLMKLDASSEVKGLTISGPTLYPILATNVAAGAVKSDKLTSKVTIGSETKLADFSIEETNDIEDLNVKAITFEIDGVDADDIDDLVLTAEGKKVTADFAYQRGKIVASMDYTIAKDSKVDFVLKGTVVSGIKDTLEVAFDKDAVYAIGADTNVTASVTVDEKQMLLAKKVIEGAEISVSFKKTDVDAVTPDTSDFKVGTLVLTSTSDYSINELTLTIENTKSDLAIEKILKNVELNGQTADKESGEKTKKATYTFEDFYLTAGETKELPIAFTVKDEDDDILNGLSLKLTPAITEVEDEDNNETYKTDSELSKILSTTALAAKKIKIESGKFQLEAVDVRPTDIVLYNGVKAVAHKMRAFIGDASDVTLKSMSFTTVGTANTISDIEDVIDTATLNIGGKSFDCDVDEKTVDCNSINATILAGADNVEVLFYLTLKDNDNISGSTLALQFEEVEAEDDNNTDLTVARKNLITTKANQYKTQINIQKSGSFYAKVTNSTDKIDTTILAGTSNVNLANVEMQAELENADIDELVFEIGADKKVAATSSTGTFTVTKSDVTSGKDATTTKEKTKLVVTTDPTVTGTITVTVNGQVYNVDVLNTDSADQVATKIKDAIGSLATLSDTNVVVIESADLTAQDDAVVDVKDTKAVIKTVVIEQGGVTTAATPKVEKLTFNRAMYNGDTVTYNGKTYTSFSALAADIQAQADVATATVDGNVITITSASKGATATMTVATPTTTAYAGTRASTTKNVDLTSTLKNVRLVKDGKTLVDGGKLEYGACSSAGYTNCTKVIFEDFILPKSAKVEDYMLVADVNKYSTSGSEDIVTLANLEVFGVKAVAEGAQSDEKYANATLTGKGNKIHISPIETTYAVSSKFGSGTSSSIKFTVKTGENDIDNDDIILDTVYFETKLNATNVQKLTVVINGVSKELTSVDTQVLDLKALFTKAERTIETGDKVKFIVTKKAGDDSDVDLTILENGITYTSADSDVDGLFEVTNDDTELK